MKECSNFKTFWLKLKEDFWQAKNNAMNINVKSRNWKQGILIFSLKFLRWILNARIIHLETQMKDATQTQNNEDQEKIHIARKKLEAMVFDLTMQVNELNNKNNGLQREIERFRHWKQIFSLFSPLIS